MTICVALNHRTEYHYDRLTEIHPQIVRLRPAPHTRTPVRSYSLRVSPEEHFVNWQQDPHGNFQARFVFPKPATELKIEVDLVVDMTVINPFDFFVEEPAKKFPFQYDSLLKRQLRPFLETDAGGTKFDKYVADVRKALKSAGPQGTVDYLVSLNQRLSQEIGYTIRMEPGVQSPNETLTLMTGSCRDSSWLLVQLLRQIGLASRFVSGYLIQLAPDEKSLDGPSGTEVDFTDLHAWAEVFLPGAGWVGLDPTSGLMAGEGHIPLACTPDPSTAAPISGSIGECEVEFDFDMSIVRIHEDPRVTKPYTTNQVRSIHELGHEVDRRLNEQDVRLTMGGEPTFLSIDDMDGAQWNTDAVGVEKRELSEKLIRRLRARFGPGGLLHFGQGKWYPGESLPRWALACYWRKDGVTVWKDDSLIADSAVDYGFEHAQAKQFAHCLAKLLGVARRRILPAFEDVAHFLLKEGRLPVNVTPEDPKLDDPEERSRMVRVFQRGVGTPVGFVLPIQRQWWQAKSRWVSGPWPVRSEKLFLLPGDSPVGLRLPLDQLPHGAGQPPGAYPPVDPTVPTGELPRPLYDRPIVSSEREGIQVSRHNEQVGDASSSNSPLAGDQRDLPAADVYEDARNQYLEDEPDDVDDLDADDGAEVDELVRTALCVEARDGKVCVFMPPTERMEDYLDLVAAVEATAEALQMPVVVEGYPPPHDSRVANLKVTPDPGVIEVNTHPTDSWQELVDVTVGLYEDARQTRLGTNKFDLDGQHTGTGGGNHVVLGASTPLQSPFLRRPDLLKSLIAYWNNHPSLSYLFSGKFIGPTSQAPRADEGRADVLYELDLAFQHVPPPGTDSPPWLVDRLFRNLLTDLTGNTHRAEFCIDKLYSPDSSTGRLGLVELRGFEMPPHPEMSLTQQLLIRACVSAFWDQPYNEPLVEWGTQLHDRFMLPEFIWADFCSVIDDLNRRGIALDKDWFMPHWEFRFPKIGHFACGQTEVDLRTAIEPWYVLGEEPAGGGTVRFVDSSVQRLQVRVRGLHSRNQVLVCNGRRLPLAPTGTAGVYACGVRYRAWQPPSCLHPTIPVHAPLTLDIIDPDIGRSLGGCRYHVSHPAGRNYETFPVNANEAEARRGARFFAFGHTPGMVNVGPPERNEKFPLTLDLRRPPTR
ncbi:MAG: transglutaminase family protein [Aureliella sp.]